MDINNTIIYLSHETCSVCKVLRPKIEGLANDFFPEMNFLYLNVKENPEKAAEFQVFTVPTILVFFEGKEYIRKSRNISVEELKDNISRFYEMVFD